MAGNIDQGVLKGYVDPPAAGGPLVTAIGATPGREKKSSDATTQDLLHQLCELMRDVRMELQILNENLLTNVNMDYERRTRDRYADPFSFYENSTIDSY